MEALTPWVAICARGCPRCYIHNSSSFTVAVPFCYLSTLHSIHSRLLAPVHLDSRVAGVGGSTGIISFFGSELSLPADLRLFDQPMKATRARGCTLFPWLFKTLDMNSPKDITCGSKMVELRGLGDVARYERAGLSYTSLRDVIAAQKRNPTLQTEIDDLRLCVDDNRPRTPKSRLLEKAALAWLQPTVCDRGLQQNNFFLRYWLKCTKQTTPPFPWQDSSTPLSRCLLHLPFLRCFDISPNVERLPEPKTFPLLRY